MIKKLLAALNDEVIEVFNESYSSFSDIEGNYRVPDTQDNKEFDANLKCESDEWFCIKPDDTKREEMLGDYIGAVEGTGSINGLKRSNYKDVKSLMFTQKETLPSGEDKVSILFTRVYPRQKIGSTKIIIEQDPKLQKIPNSVDVTGKVDAYWDSEILYFRSYQKIANLFPGISEFYSTATEQEQRDFIKGGIFDLKKTFIIKESNKKRIAYIMRERNIDFTNPSIRQKYKDYSIKYGKNISFGGDNKIVLESNSDLTSAIQIIEGHCWTCEVTGEMRETSVSHKLKT